MPNVDVVTEPEFYRRIPVALVPKGSQPPLQWPPSHFKFTPSAFHIQSVTMAGLVGYASSDGEDEVEEAQTSKVSSILLASHRLY